MSPLNAAEQHIAVISSLLDELQVLLERNPRTDFAEIEADLEGLQDDLADMILTAGFFRRMREVEATVAQMLTDKYARLELVERHAQRLDLRHDLEPVILAAALTAGWSRGQFDDAWEGRD